VAAYDGEGLTSLCDEHGLLTARRALESGVTDRCLQRLTRGGLLVHLFRGVYLLGSRRVLTAEGFHAQLMRGARLLFADAVFTSSSAVVGHGVEVYGASLAQPIIRRPVDRGQGPRGMVVRRQASAWVDTAYGPCVPLATALVEVAINRGVQAGMVTAELALASGKVSRAEFGAAIEAVALWPHSSRAKAVGRLVRGQCESVAEARTLFLLLVNGVEVECQVEICDPDGRFVARVDFLVTGTKLVVEFDGKVKYASGDPEVLWREKRREDALRALGYDVVRLTWADLEHPAQAMAKVRRALAQHARRP
jgi:very-short-patch-repair endonuclease